MPTVSPHSVDVYVGLRVRARRKELGVSQVVLADRVGITFQQIQKYESGANRISASKLFEIADALSTGPGWFFEGLPPGEDDGQADHVDVLAKFIATSGGFEIASIWPRLTTQRRRELFKLMQAMDLAP